MSEYRDAMLALLVVATSSLFVVTEVRADALCYCTDGRSFSAIGCQNCYCGPPPVGVQACNPFGPVTPRSGAGKPCNDENGCRVIGGVCGGSRETQNNWCHLGSTVQVVGGVAVAGEPMTVRLVVEQHDLGSRTDESNQRRFLIHGSTTVDWGDASPQVSIADIGTQAASHTYVTAGRYRVRITQRGDFKWEERVNFRNSCSYQCSSVAEGEVTVVQKGTSKFLGPQR